VLGVEQPARRASGATASRQQLGDAVATIWQRFRGATLERVKVLEDAVVSMLEGTLDAETRRRAEREAHKLAGGVGTFGFAEASRLARSAELLLEGTGVLESADALRLSDLVVALRTELERPTPPASAAETAPGDDESQATLALITVDADLAERVTMEAEGRQISTRWVRKPTEGVADADAIVVDMSGALAGGAGLAYLDGLASEGGSRPIIVIAERDTFAERVHVARRGGRVFLSRPVPPRAVVDAVAGALRLTDVSGARVLAVDDDAQVLEALRALLERRGIDVTTLNDPLRFWETLEHTRPDLLILDEDMPYVSGIELCRVIRADARWRLLPVLFLTARTDRASIQRFFHARADDYATKPFAGPEIVARIESRLERARLERALVEREVGGVGTRRRVDEDVERLVAIAQRTREPLAVAAVRMDDADTMRARFGGTAWEAIARRVSALLRAALQNGDVVGQTGPEEFLVAAYGTDCSAAVHALDGVRARVRGEEIPSNDGPMRVGFSAGVAEYPADGSTAAELRAAACDAMTRAQTSGGGGIVACGGERQRADVVDVVVIDDDPALADLILHALGTRGLTTRWLRDGDTAVAELAGPTPSLRAGVVLLDVDLPGRDGFTVLRALANDGIVARTHVIMLTVRSSESEVVKALEMGAADHVAKPFSMQVLMRRIQRALTGD
jgi:diguanylate cyclase (GGDEF)-like protein